MILQIDLVPSRTRGASRTSLLGRAGFTAGLFGLILITMGLLADRLWAAAAWFPLINSVALICMLPDTPSARPWPAIVSHCMTASIGVAMAMVFGPSLLTGAIAASLGVLGMVLTRSIHPPATATALLYGAGSHPSLSLLPPIMIGAVTVACCGVAVRALKDSHVWLRGDGT